MGFSHYFWNINCPLRTFCAQNNPITDLLQGTNQVCLFRDGYEKLSSTGLLIFGLSADSPKANANFKSKQDLQYSLLCDPASTLISAIGLKRVPRGTIRGVFAVDKGGKVLLLERGGPAATVNAVRKLVEVPSGTADKESNEARHGITSS